MSISFIFEMFLHNLANWSRTIELWEGGEGCWVERVCFQCFLLTIDPVDPLHSVPATAVVTVCPDCPTSDNLNEPVVKDTVALALKTFNEDSRLVNYFTMENITRASSQVKRNREISLGFISLVKNYRLINLKWLLFLILLRHCEVHLHIVVSFVSVGFWSILLCGVHHRGDSMFKDDRSQRAEQLPTDGLSVCCE